MFDTGAGEARFDADGNGGDPAVLIATFDFDPGTLAVDDIFMIA